MSLLSSAKQVDVIDKTFPPVVIRNVLDEALCSRLMAEFTPVDLVMEGAAQGSNRRFRYAARMAGYCRCEDIGRLETDCSRIRLAVIPG